MKAQQSVPPITICRFEIRPDGHNIEILARCDVHAGNYDTIHDVRVVDFTGKPAVQLPHFYTHERLGTRVRLPIGRLSQMWTRVREEVLRRYELESEAGLCS